MNVMVICGTKAEADRAAFAAGVPQEAAHLRELQDAGALVQAWSLRGPGTVLVLEVADEAAANAIADNLPLASAGLENTEVIPVSPLRL
jgi:hypothetical protein